MPQVFATFARASLPVLASAAVTGLHPQPARAYDLTPPVLKSIRTTGSVNALRSDQFVTVTLDMTDDLSGITYYRVKFESPSGRQFVLREKNAATPLLEATPVLEVGATPYGDWTFGRFAEPGIWRATQVYVSDADNNGTNYDADQLPAFGSTTFTVTNAGGYDIEPPTLKSGTIDTPTISLSTAPNGTRPGTLPFASMQMLVSDTGDGAVSGMQYAAMMFCWYDTIVDCGANFTLEGITNHAGVRNATVTAGTQMQRQQAPGHYVLVLATLQDNAGNTAQYISSLFGGDTDFSKLFPGGTSIQVNP